MKYRSDIVSSWSRLLATLTLGAILVAAYWIMLPWAVEAAVARQWL